MPSVSGDPSESAFHDPPFWQDDESLDSDGPKHRLQQPTERLADPGGQAAAGVSAVGEHNLQPAAAGAEGR